MTWYRQFKTAMPIPTDFIYNLHDERLRKAIPPNTEIIVYHGTNSIKLASILQHGFLDPSQAELNKNYKNSSNGIFVTTSIGGFTGAGMYAHHSTITEDERVNGDPVLLELVIPIGWIDQDPDDTRFDEETNDINDLGRTQGIVRRPINIKRIRQIKAQNPELMGFNPWKGNNKIEQNWVAWMPIGKFIDMVSKAINKGIELPEEYQEMANMIRPRGLSRSKPYNDNEYELAMGLLMYHDTFNSPGEVSLDNILSWVFENKISPFQSANDVMTKFFTDFNMGNYQEFLKNEAGEMYTPRGYEAALTFLNRCSR